jgi:hypothetical protein
MVDVVRRERRPTVVDDEFGSQSASFSTRSPLRAPSRA